MVKTEDPARKNEVVKKSRRWIWTLTLGVPLLLLIGLLIIWASSRGA